MSPKPTLQRIADIVGVSPTTVHRALTGKPHVAEMTRDSVRHVALELGYKPRAGRLIGLIVPDSSNPFFSALGYGFEIEFARRGAHLMVSSSEGIAGREYELVQRFISIGATGLIYISTSSGKDSVLRLVEKQKLPAVVFDRRVKEWSDLDVVTVNNAKGIDLAVAHLANCDHTRIGFIRGLSGTATAAERQEAFEKAILRRSLPSNPSWLFPGDYQFTAGAACAEALIASKPEDRPTAIIAANDLMAIGLMSRLQKAGWKLPDELSVIGFDGIPWCEWTHPALTTVAQPIEQLVETAAQVLCAAIDRAESGGVHTAIPHELDPKLEVRDSVGRPFK
jgi:LacI family transcriptional regulator